MLKLVLTLYFVSLSSFALEPNLIDGKILYEESCAQCHGSDYYLGLGMDEMTNIYEILHWVEGCSKHFHLGWNDQDITDTAHFLNKEYFHLTIDQND